jgi:alcohol dehydrogenase class IV
MSKFEFAAPMRIIFGRGEFGRVGELAAAMGRKAMVIYNGPGGVDRLAQSLSAVQISVALWRQRGEPVVADVDAATRIACESDAGLVIGLGGGSAIDAAKAVAALLANGGSAAEYMEVVGRGQKITRQSIPWIAIPTTAGTGAEATRNAVIGLPERRFKASIRSELMLPRVALIDPELGVDVPADVTARSGADALCQLIESYTSTGAGAMTDALALQGMTLASRSLLRAFRDGRDLSAREDMAMAALLSGMCLTNAGLGAVHGFAAPLGANFPVPHGTVCAALLPHVIAGNVAALKNAPQEQRERGLNRYGMVGRRLFSDETLSDAAAIDGAISFTSELVRDLQVPPLREFGIRETDVSEMVALSRKASSMRFNPVVLSDDELARILISGIRGNGIDA